MSIQDARTCDNIIENLSKAIIVLEKMKDKLDIEDREQHRQNVQYDKLSPCQKLKLKTRFLKSLKD